MGLLDFLKKKNKGIAAAKFNSEQFQLELMAVALWKMKESNNPNSAIKELKKVGLNEEQVQLILKKTKQFEANEKPNDLNKKGIDQNTFNSEQYKNEITALAQTIYFENNHDYNIVKEKLTQEGLNHRQSRMIIENLKSVNSKMVNDFQGELDSGRITEIKIQPNPDHKKGTSDKDQVDKYIGYGAYQMNRGDLDNALELFDKALELDDKAVLAYANKGTLYSKLGDLNAALANYNKAIDINPKQEMLHTNKGLVLDDLNRLEEAIQAYEIALKINPNDIQALNNLGINYAKQADFKKALDCFEKLLKFDPKDSDALLNKLNTLTRVDIEKGKAFYEVLKVELKDNEEIHYAIPNAYFETNKHDLIDSYFDTEIKKGNQRFQMFKAHFYYTKDQNKAVAIYTEIIKNEPKNQEALEYRMHLLKELNQHDALMQAIEENLAADSLNPNALSYKTQLFLEKNDTENALETVKILFKNFHQEQISIQLILDVLGRMDFEKSLNEISLFEKELDQNAAYQLNYCKGLHLKGLKEYDDAIKVFEQINKIHQFEWNYYQIAIIKNLQGKTQECLNYLKTTFELSPILKQDAKQYAELQNLWDNSKFIELTK
ncbi:MAG: tetratricopeptide repeat protein [Crocinitomix sp.]|nr:tetratricopeptide repeat protein [Crocinitomix sp.]